jgi:hypothetical protein
MNLGRRVSSLVAFVFLSTVACFAQQVKFDYDRSADFNQYKTFSWGTVHTQNPLWVERIKSAVDSALTAKGWTLVDSGRSVSIMAMEMNETHQTLNTYYDGFGGGWRWGGLGDSFGDSTTTESTYKVGTLVVDLFDSKTKTLIWRGSASDTLSDKSDKNIKHLDKAVDKLFERFPPGERN